MRVMMMSRDLGIHLEIMMWITQLMKVLVKLLSLSINHQLHASTSSSVYISTTLLYLIPSGNRHKTTCNPQAEYNQHCHQRCHQNSFTFFVKCCSSKVYCWSWKDCNILNWRLILRDFEQISNLFFCYLLKSSIHNLLPLVQPGGSHSASGLRT